MTIINVPAGRKQSKTMEMTDADFVKILQEYDLMLEELENLLQEELLAIYLLRNKNDQEPMMIFETAVRLLERKKNRSIRQDAILAYAKKRLKELEEEKIGA